MVRLPVILVTILVFLALTSCNLPINKTENQVINPPESPTSVPTPAFAPFCEEEASVSSQPRFCPTPFVLTGQQFCQNGVPYTNVLVPEGSSLSVPDKYQCVDGGTSNGSHLYSCTGAPNTSFQLEAQVPQCDLGYVYNADLKKCVFKGPAAGQQNRCPQGFTYDPSAQCCVANKGTDYPGCQEGDSFNQSLGACEPSNNSANRSCDIAQVSIVTCSAKHGGGAGGGPVSCAPFGTCSGTYDPATGKCCYYACALGCMAPP